MKQTIILSNEKKVYKRHRLLDYSRKTTTLDFDKGNHKMAESHSLDKHKEGADIDSESQSDFSSDSEFSKTDKSDFKSLTSQISSLSKTVNKCESANKKRNSRRHINESNKNSKLPLNKCTITELRTIKEDDDVFRNIKSSENIDKNCLDVLKPVFSPSTTSPKKRSVFSMSQKELVDHVVLQIYSSIGHLSHEVGQDVTGHPN